MSRIRFMNTVIDSLSMQEALDSIAAAIDRKAKMLVVTPNVDHLVKLEGDAAFRSAYEHAGLVLVDGTPLMWIARWYGTPFKEKITGPRLTQRVFELSAQKGFSVFILGAAEGVAEAAAQNMRRKYSGCRIVGTYSPRFGFENDPEETKNIIQRVNRCRPDILVSGMGSPKTEIFLDEHLQALDTHVAISIGAAIDFMAGSVKRCPEWVNRIGLEWLYRFMKEPKRMFRRYFVEDIKILSMAIKYRNRRHADE